MGSYCPLGMIAYKTIVAALCRGVWFNHNF